MVNYQMKDRVAKTHRWKQAERGAVEGGHPQTVVPLPVARAVEGWRWGAEWRTQTCQRCWVNFSHLLSCAVEHYSL